MSVETDAGLVQRQQSAFHGRYRHSGARMGVDHALHIDPGFVDRTVDHKAGAVDAVIGIRLPDDIPLDINLDQARCGDLPVKKPVEIDQQVIRIRNARRNVVVDQVRHAEVIDQTVAGGEIDTRPPFRVAHFTADGAEFRAVIHGSSVARVIGLAEAVTLIGDRKGSVLLGRHFDPVRFSIVRRGRLNARRSRRGRFHRLDRHHCVALIRQIGNEHSGLGVFLTAEQREMHLPEILETRRTVDRKHGEGFAALARAVVHDAHARPQRMVHDR